MSEHFDLGLKGEELARNYLKENNYQIRATNWRFGKNEIDIIAIDQKEIVIVEVKTRSTRFYGDPEVFVTKTKQRFLVKAAHAYIIQKNINLDCRFDIIAAGLYITPKRCRQVAFTNPTYSIGEGFLVKKGNPKNLHSYDDIKNKNNVKLGAVAATVELGYARKVGIPEDRIVIFPDNISAVAGVKSGRIDALATTSITVAKLAEKEPGVEKAAPFTDPVIDGKSVRGYGALAVRKADRKLLAVLNAHLKEIIGSNAHKKAVAQYGFTEENLPGSIEASSLCGQ